MITEVRTPGSGPRDEGLHHGPLCLDRVYQIMRRPFVEEFCQRDRPQFTMACRPREVGWRDAREERETRRPALGKRRGKLARRLPRARLPSLRIGIKGCEILPREQGLYAAGKDPLLGIEQML